MRRLTPLLALVILCLAGPVSADPIPPDSPHGDWLRRATDVLVARDVEPFGERTPDGRDRAWFASNLERGVLAYDQLPIGGGEGNGEDVGRVLVRHAAYELGGRLGGDGPWIEAPAGWDFAYVGLAPLPEPIIQCESGGNPLAYNPSGAAGLAQWLPGTWASINGQGDPRDASESEQRWRGSLLWANGYGASHWAECL